MIEYARMEPSAPPISSVPNNLNFRVPSSQPTVVPPHQPKVLNIPPVTYSVPGAIQETQPPFVPAVPAAALKPIRQPPPAPSLNEVSLNEERLRVRCPYCYASIITKVTYRAGVMTRIVAFAIVCVFFPLAWVPYVFDCCKDVEHTCPNCGRSIGRFKRFN